MRKVISFLVLLAVLFLIFEFAVTFFIKEYVVNYSIFSNKQEIKIKERYQENNGNIYDVEVSVGNKKFYYIIKNKFNKQKRIIKDIVYFEDNEDMCIYPILKDYSAGSIECIKDDNLYIRNSFPNTNLLNMITNDMDNKGFRYDYNEEYINKYDNTTIYQKNIVDDDNIIIWNYKGVSVISNTDTKSINVLTFDKYNNKVGTLVGRYYVIPKYENSKVLEFNKIELINVENYKVDEIALKDYTLSSDTYVNGVVKGKLYYTDPSNLIQLEINVTSNFYRLIGSVDLGGQMYEEKWTTRNIYDFKQEIKYGITPRLEEYPNCDVYEGKGVYYVKDNIGNVYQVSKNHVDKKVFLFNNNDINNINVVGNDLYYVIGDTLYAYYHDIGIVRIAVNKDLLYNTTNRISVYRRNS